jgi:hypothetical protein
VAVAEWLRVPDADPSEAKAWLDELREQIAIGVGDAEEQVSDIDTSKPATVKQAQATLAALSLHPELSVVARDRAGA